MFDILEHPDVREAAIMKGVQTGISKLLQAAGGVRAHRRPVRAGHQVLPSREAGARQIKKHWGPMLRGKDCPVLKPLFTTTAAPRDPAATGDRTSRDG